MDIMHLRHLMSIAPCSFPLKELLFGFISGQNCDAHLVNDGYDKTKCGGQTVPRPGTAKPATRWETAPDGAEHTQNNNTANSIQATQLFGT